MDYLLTHTDKDIFKNPEFSVPDKYKERITVKSITINNEGKYGFVTNSIHGFYLLAGGGAESDNLEVEIKRECDEELNAEVQVLSKVGVIHEYRNRNAKEYKTTCFITKVIGISIEDIRTEDEKNNGLCSAWFNKKETIKIIKQQQEKVKNSEVYFYNTAFDMVRDAKFFEEYLRLNN